MMMDIFFKFTKISRVCALVVLIFLVSCNSKQSELDKQISQIPITSEIIRFDQIFIGTPDDSLFSVKQRFPYLFNASIEDSFWLAKKKDTLFIELNEEVDKKFSSQSLQDLNKELIAFFQHVKYYFPSQSSNKKVITLISEVDVQTKAIYADSLVFLSLDTYLGQDHRFYKGFSHYLRSDFNDDQILADLSKNFVQQNISAPRDRVYVSQMVFYGKVLYAQKTLLPKVPDNILMGYSKEQLQWCQENQESMWRYFMENDYLFSTDIKLIQRFIEPAPFSKFYLEIDEQAPGKIGAWLGWQIVDSYMRNNNVTLQELLDTNAEEIFQKSKYKPKK
ncbi:gliding motility lipoprotein GldB [Myroides sp. LJL116]